MKTVDKQNRNEILTYCYILGLMSHWSVMVFYRVVLIFGACLTQEMFFAFKQIFFIRTFYNASSVALSRSVDSQRAFSGFF